MNFGKPPKIKKPAMIPMTNTDHSTDTIHDLKSEIGRRRTSLYANPGDKVIKETGTPSYFTGIKRLLRTRYGSGGQ